MATLEKIAYRDFWDVPRMFVVWHDDAQYLFDCRFDDVVEDYEQMYQVYVLPGLSEDELQGSWKYLPAKAVTHLGEVLVSSVIFDSSQRLTIDTRIIDEVEDLCG